MRNADYPIYADDGSRYHDLRLLPRCAATAQHCRDRVLLVRLEGNTVRSIYCQAHTCRKAQNGALCDCEKDPAAKYCRNRRSPCHVFLSLSFLHSRFSPRPPRLARVRCHEPAGCYLSLISIFPPGWNHRASLLVKTSLSCRVGSFSG